MSNEAFREKIGLDYLLKGGRKQQQTPAPSAAQQYIDAALQSYGLRVLAALKKGSPARLYDLVDSLSIDLQTLLAVAEHLSESDLVEITDRDPKGNFELQLTARGRAVPVSGM